MLCSMPNLRYVVTQRLGLTVSAGEPARVWNELSLAQATTALRRLPLPPLLTLQGLVLRGGIDGFVCQAFEKFRNPNGLPQSGSVDKLVQEVATGAEAWWR